MRIRRANESLGMAVGALIIVLGLLIVGPAGRWSDNCGRILNAIVHRASQTNRHILQMSSAEFRGRRVLRRKDGFTAGRWT